MSRKQEHNVTSRTNNDAPLRDTPYELLEKARHMLLQAAELYHKEGNPTETAVFRIIAELSSVMNAQERASYYNHPQHQSPNCINQQKCATSVTGPSLTKRVKKGVASRAPLNSNKKSRFLDEGSSIYTDDSDRPPDREPYQKVVKYLGTTAKKKTLSAKLKLATSLNYNESSHSDLTSPGSASNTNAANGSNSKKKRKQKEETKANHFKVQVSLTILFGCMTIPLINRELNKFFFFFFV